MSSKQDNKRYPRSTGWLVHSAALCRRVSWAEVV